MTNPTTYFSWQMPTATDLVTDLPADFEVFGQAVDTDFQGLLGGTTGQILSKTSATDLAFTWTTPNPGDITGVTAGVGITGGGTSGDVTVTNSMATAIDAKGDLIGGTGADAFSRLAVGANDTVLTADSAQATGLKWSAPVTGGMTLLSTTALTGASVSISVTPTGYTALQMYIKDAYGTVDDVQCRIRFNSDTGTNYGYSAIRYDGGSVSGVGEISANSIPYIFIAIPSNNTTLRKGNAFVNIFSPNSTDNFAVNWQGYGFKNAGTGGNVAGNGVYDGSAAITSIQFSPGSGSWSGGNVYLYGVK